MEIKDTSNEPSALIPRIAILAAQLARDNLAEVAIDISGLGSPDARVEIRVLPLNPNASIPHAVGCTVGGAVARQDEEFVKMSAKPVEQADRRIRFMGETVVLPGKIVGIHQDEGAEPTYIVEIRSGPHELDRARITVGHDGIA